ncbi:anti-apoptotic protein NR13-like isoform X1 [Brienomyrus brachyistius]|uniref:anti-apoptotic protein NR13-like isoform X1 n=1 Tax=Brienomyrus brachyistius TaxID=42636 RepID=UPI0020B36C95|nr:anti-apoptotic protein NR13-like isoform X1 [Brienomyrus brachyistius]
MATSLQEETLIVANDYMDFCIGIKKAPPSEAAKAMRYLGKDVERIYGFRLRPLVQFFLNSSGFDTWSKLRSVMLEVVGREGMSWGQIVSLFSFTGILAVQLYTGEEDVACSRRLAEILTEVLIGEKEEWMVQNGGWRGFIKYVQKIRPEYPVSPMKTAFLITTNIAIAGIAFLLVR